MLFNMRTLFLFDQFNQGNIHEVFKSKISFRVIYTFWPFIKIFKLYRSVKYYSFTIITNTLILTDVN